MWAGKVVNRGRQRERERAQRAESERLWVWLAPARWGYTCLCVRVYICVYPLADWRGSSARNLRSSNQYELGSRQRSDNDSERAQHVATFESENNFWISEYFWNLKSEYYCSPNSACVSVSLSINLSYIAYTIYHRSITTVSRRGSEQKPPATFLNREGCAKFSNNTRFLIHVN